MRYIDYDSVPNPIMGDIYYDKESACMKIWHNNTWTPIVMTEDFHDRRKELLEEFDKNPELYNDIVVEMRRKKIERLKK